VDRLSADRRKSRHLQVPATTETYLPGVPVPGLFVWAVRAVHSRMVPRSPCSVAAISPRLGPGASVMCSMRARTLGRLVAFLRAPERFREAFHPAAVDAGDVRENVRDINRRAGETFGQLVLLCFQIAKVGMRGRL
jgi:hypothetical protein